MTDVFREVDEEVRREQLKKLWERYQILVYAAVILIVFGVGGWRVYEWWDARRSAEIGTQFETAMSLAESGDHAEAEKAFARIAAEGTSGYRGLARLRQAAEAARRDPDAGVEAYRQIVNDGSIEEPLRELAALRAAAMLIDKESYDEARKLLEPLTDASKTFRHSARELVALAAWRTGDTAALRRWYGMMLTDPETPPSARSRVEMLIALDVVPESKS